MDFPKREQRNHNDIFPGLTFYFVDNPNGADMIFDRDAEQFDRTCAWIVIGKERVVKLDGGYWRYLLLGAGPTLRWHDGQLGWIRRIADPVWEARYASGWGLTHIKQYG
jgi:hypothetical protein